MLTCRSRQTTESPGEEGVGTAVGVGCGGAVVGVTEDSTAGEQAVNRNSPTNKILEVFFMASPGYPITFNTLDDLARFF